MPAFFCRRRPVFRAACGAFFQIAPCSEFAFFACVAATAGGKDQRMTSLPRVGGVFGFIIAHNGQDCDHLDQTLVKMGTTKLNHEQTEFLIEIVRK